MLRWLTALIVVLNIVKYVYIKVPDNAEEPWKVRLSSFGSFFTGDMAYLTEYIGCDSKKMLGKFSFYRYRVLNWFFPAPTDVTHQIVEFDGMLLDMYRPADVSIPLPAVLVFYDGGWLWGGLGSGSNINRRIASLAKVAVFGFSYTRTTDDFFPAQFDECEFVARHLMSHTAENNVIPGQIGVLGEGAGGNLAMAVSLKLSTEPVEGSPPLKFMALFDPYLQSLDFNLTSYHQYDVGSYSFTQRSKTNALFCFTLYGFGHFKYIQSLMDNSHTTIATKTKYRKFVNSSLLERRYRTEYTQERENVYVDYKIKKIILNPYFSPLMASDDQLKGLPNTYLTLSEYNVLRDEGMILAERLRLLNHVITYNYLEGRSYGILTNVHFRSSTEEYVRLALYINRTFGRETLK